jgi:hypothetical protein
MDASQARNHIEMVERILAESSQRLCAGGEYFVVWGIGSAAVTTLFSLAAVLRIPPSALWGVPVILIACVLFSVLRGRSTRGTLARSSLVQREFFNVLWLTIGVAFVVNAAAFRLFPGIASAAIWSVAAVIVLFFIGIHGNRRAQVAGIVVVVSLIAANFAPVSIAGYVLAGGMLAGYGGFGLAELLIRE